MRAVLPRPLLTPSVLSRDRPAFKKKRLHFSDFNGCEASFPTVTQTPPLRDEQDLAPVLRAGWRRRPGAEPMPVRPSALGGCAGAAARPSGGFRACERGFPHSRRTLTHPLTRGVPNTYTHCGLLLLRGEGRKEPSVKPSAFSSVYVFGDTLYVDCHVTRTQFTCIKTGPQDAPRRVHSARKPVPLVSLPGKGVRFMLVIRRVSSEGFLRRSRTSAVWCRGRGGSAGRTALCEFQQRRGPVTSRLPRLLTSLTRRVTRGVRASRLRPPTPRSQGSHTTVTGAT